MASDIPSVTCRACGRPSHFPICKRCGTTMSHIDGGQYRGLRMYEWVMSDSNKPKTKDDIWITSSSTSTSQASTASTASQFNASMHTVTVAPVKKKMGGRISLGKVGKVLKSLKGFGRSKAM